MKTILQILVSTTMALWFSSALAQVPQLTTSATEYISTVKYPSLNTKVLEGARNGECKGIKCLPSYMNTHVPGSVMSVHYQGSIRPVVACSKKSLSGTTFPVGFALGTKRSVKSEKNKDPVLFSISIRTLVRPTDGGTIATATMTWPRFYERSGNTRLDFIVRKGATEDELLLFHTDGTDLPKFGTYSPYAIINFVDSEPRLTLNFPLALDKCSFSFDAPLTLAEVGTPTNTEAFEPVYQDSSGAAWGRKVFGVFSNIGDASSSEAMNICDSLGQNPGEVTLPTYEDYRRLERDLGFDPKKLRTSKEMKSFEDKFGFSHLESRIYNFWTSSIDNVAEGAMHLPDPEHATKFIFTTQMSLSWNYARTPQMVICIKK